jgi:hypothetical protein
VAVLVIAGTVLAARNVRKDPAKSRDTLAVEAKAGDFADYWAEVLKLSRRYIARPDSFRIALEALPGSQLSEAEWNAWVEPYHKDPLRLAGKIERAMAEMTETPSSPVRLPPLEGPPLAPGTKPLTSGRTRTPESAPQRAIPAPRTPKQATRPSASGH